MRKTLITTTSTLEGWEITEYLGPISAQFVIGTGIFTEFFSNWTDFFGAHSGSYERKLAKINIEALSQLQSKAEAMGADAILGTRIDHDEVSGGGKSMLMVTAMGTAVKAKAKAAETQGIDTEKERTPISSRDLAVLLKRRELVKATKEGKLDLNQETWEFLIEYQVDEIAPFLLNKIIGDQPIMTVYGELVNRAKEYFRSLPITKATEYLYGALSASGRARAFAMENIRVLELMDWNHFRQLLRSEDEEVRSSALQIVSADKAFYTPEDIGQIEAVVDEIKKAFPVRARYIEKKGMLSSKMKKKWLCECGKENDEEKERCAFCSKDVYGFQLGTINPPEAIRILTTKFSILRERFLT